MVIQLSCPQTTFKYNEEQVFNYYVLKYELSSTKSLIKLAIFHKSYNFNSLPYQ